MNSDEEKRLFEEHGWQYDHVKRSWVSPESYSGRHIVISNDDLVEHWSASGHTEMELRRVIRQYGSRLPTEGTNR